MQYNSIICWQVLGVRRDACRNVRKTAFKTLMLQLHPDKVGVVYLISASLSGSVQ